MFIPAASLCEFFVQLLFQRLRLPDFVSFADTDEGYLLSGVHANTFEKSQWKGETPLRRDGVRTIEKISLA
jgi:hypothetical protein